MATADLHVHSRYSEAPSGWFMRWTEAAECYTDPETIYELAKERGMTFVTLTDHNSIEGSLLLKERHPTDVFTGCEVTATFPEDGCEVHILVYGLNEEEFNEIQRLRRDIYALRAYLFEKHLAHSVAHATHSVNGLLTLEHLEKLLLLFDVFEGRNGGRSKIHNETWIKALRNLTPSRLEDLRRKHRIEVLSVEPWIKGLTGGSDDHAGVFVGRTYTVATAETTADFLKSLLARKSLPEGRHNDHQSLAFTIGKVAYDFSKTQREAKLHPVLAPLSELLFEAKPSSSKSKLHLGLLSFLAKKTRKKVHASLEKLVQSLWKKHDLPLDARFEYAYAQLSDITDNLLRTCFKSIAGDLEKRNLQRLLPDLSLLTSTLTLAAPFLLTARQMNKGRQLLEELSSRLDGSHPPKGKRILWFTDSLTDLNGVSVTLNRISWLCYLRDDPLQVVTSLPPENADGSLPPNVLNLPHTFQFNLPYYESYVLRVPSLLKSLEVIYKLDPSEIIISTPGPVGLLGLLAAKLLGIKSVGIYHTDFGLQIREISGEASLAKLVAQYVDWFYSCMDEVRAPSRAYTHILKERGFNEAKLSVFHRGVDLNFFRPEKNGRKFLRQHFKLEEGPTLLYVGRVSKDKNLDFLAECYMRLFARRPDLNLLIVGDGPYLQALRAKMKAFPRVIFTGRVRWETLPKFYSAADFFVFPSITDTFGMAVLEAQSCGLPCIVTDVGGPQEIILDGQSGFVARAGDLADWEGKIERLLMLWESDKEAYLSLRAKARANVLRNFSWDSALAEITGRDLLGCDDKYSLRSAHWLMQWAAEPLDLGPTVPQLTFLELGEDAKEAKPLDEVRATGE